jgi:hypothetical protein
MDLNRIKTPLAGQTRLAKVLLVMIGFITAAHVVTVSLDSDFRAGLIKTFVEALSIN